MILHTPHYPVNKSIPGFSVFRNHKRIESIESYWMEIANLNIEKALHGLEAIPLADPKTNIITSFQRVYDSVKLPDDPTIKHIKVAISFQIHSYGNFAVIRNALEKPKTSERSDKDAIPSEQKDSPAMKLSAAEAFQKSYFSDFERGLLGNFANFEKDLIEKQRG